MTSPRRTDTTRGPTISPGCTAGTRLRVGAFFLTQSNWRDDLGNARGKIFFQTFSDFLVGLERGG